MHSPRRNTGAESDVKDYSVCAQLADWTSGVLLPRTHTEKSQTDLQLFEISFGTDVNPRCSRSPSSSATAAAATASVTYCMHESPSAHPPAHRVRKQKAWLLFSVSL